MSFSVQYPERSKDRHSRPSTPHQVGQSSTRVRRDQSRKVYIEREIVYSDAFRNAVLYPTASNSSDGRVITQPKDFQDASSAAATLAPISYNNTYRSTVTRRRSSKESSRSYQSSSPSLATSEGSDPSRRRHSSPLSPSALASGMVLSGHNTDSRPMPSARKQNKDWYKLVLEKSLVGIGSTPSTRTMAESRP